MNRRGFLKFCAAAPVAAPIAVRAAAQDYANGGFVRGVPARFTPLAVMSHEDFTTLTVDLDTSAVCERIAEYQRDVSVIVEQIASTTGLTRLALLDVFDDGSGEYIDGTQIIAVA